MVGFGYDCHRLVKGEELILGGIHIDSELGTIAHSDGDVILHALCDAILGSAGLGDIGELFPDTDPKFKGANSKIFIDEAIQKLLELNMEIVNIDITIILEKPKLRDYKPLMRKNIAYISGLQLNRVNVKAKTSEKMGFAGRSEGIEAYCICETKFKDGEK